jgi:hypothetical protein
LASSAAAHPAASACTLAGIKYVGGYGTAKTGVCFTLTADAKKVREWSAPPCSRPDAPKVTLLRPSRHAYTAGGVALATNGYFTIGTSTVGRVGNASGFLYVTFSGRISGKRASGRLEVKIPGQSPLLICPWTASRTPR